MRKSMIITFDVEVADKKATQNIIHGSNEAGFCLYGANDKYATFGIMALNTDCYDYIAALLSTKAIKTFNLTTKEL
ncbi:MAG: hypothetical protein KIT33_15685 [Candidatus Kapabacteria bacterium]|nr:hypothetical protein [Ignavibacteriota bacterium]MBX3045294.1 hypothetical protein [Ignavibacteriota bacterium]MCW5885790.1 hypothetical protein [Candidatus Kapabacteria bacterium]MCW5886412.1 hypothetical protein [Candidatus Kapabacteria bacterium]